MSDSGRPWFFGALGVLIAVGLVILIGFLQLRAAAGPGLAEALRSRLVADYSSDGGVRFGALQFSILEDLLEEVGLSPREADEESERIRLTLAASIPTATALNFAGDPPFTGTPSPTPTNTPTFTPSPTPTATFTPPPTNTPSNTPTPRPTNTPRPTATPTPPDTQDPQILPGWTLNPPPGAISTCDVSISNLHIVDPAISYGLSRVELQFRDPAGTLITSNLAPPSSGGASGGGWDAFYDGSITFSGFSSPGSAVLRVRADDMARNFASVNLGTYTNIDCP